jgi:hypothetical protein
VDEVACVVPPIPMMRGLKVFLFSILDIQRSAKKNLKAFAALTASSSGPA